MSDDHYLPLFVGDFLASTATWTGPERGLYLQMLAVSWATKALPCDPQRLCRVLGYEWQEFEPLWATVRSKFMNGGAFLTNTRLEQVRARNTEIRASRSRSASTAAKARWDASGNASRITDAMPQNAIRSVSDPIQSESKTKSKSPRAPPRKRCPDNFEITDAMREWAQQAAPDVDMALELAKFKDWEFRTARVDWPACWRTWMRTAQERAKPTAAARVSTWQPPPDEDDDAHP
jgi:uncharacterized protein YdaU (DUF1376 family)